MKHIYNSLLIVISLACILGTSCGQTSEVVRVATDATWPPFEMIDDESKELVGLDIDLMKAIALRAGLQVEFINVSFDPLLAGMAQCQYDAAISAITITPDRAADFAFSDPYFAAGQIVVVQTGNTDITGIGTLGGNVVGVQMDTTGDIEAQKIEGTTIRRYDDIGLAFQDLMNGQLDAVIADNPMALEIVGQHPDQLKTAGDVFTDENYGIAVCKTNTELVAQINSALAELIAEGYIEGLTQIWVIGSEY